MVQFAISKMNLEKMKISYMKTATYTLSDGTHITVEYDENAPCMICHKPIIEASIGGTNICPWCDMGIERPSAS